MEITPFSEYISCSENNVEAVLSMKAIFSGSRFFLLEPLSVAEVISCSEMHSF